MMRGQMPFGKWRGAWISELPPDYVAWLANNVALKPQLYTEFDRIWGKRFTFRLEGLEREPASESRTPAINWAAMRRKFAARFHPDRPGGSVEVMRAINMVFDELEAIA